MPQPQNPLDLLVAADPSLRMWRDNADDYQDVPFMQYSLLAEEVVRQAQHGTVPTLHVIAPVIERLLEGSDEHDQVSIGFVERLQELVEEQGLDSKAVYDTLGPIARRRWESLYHYRHQLHLCEIDFDQGHIAGAVQTPAQLEKWFVKPGAHVPAGTSLARISIAGRAHELQVDFGCYIDRCATSDGDALTQGSLLLYVLPDTDAHVKRRAPYCTLEPGKSSPNAAA